MFNAKSIAMILGVGMVALAGGASAAVDTTAAVGAFTDVGTAAAAVGAAMVGAAGAGIVYRWVTSFLL